MGIVGRCARRVGAEVVFDFPSVGATENVLMAAVVADGVTIIRNAAREPEIADLCNMLRKMGCRIDGIGTATLTITGVSPSSLQAVTHEVVTDRVQSATYIAAVGMCGGTIRVARANAQHMGMMLTRFTDMGMNFDIDDDGITATAPDRLTSVDVSTLPYPGVATDYKPLVVAILSVANGVGLFQGNFDSGRIRYVSALLVL